MKNILILITVLIVTVMIFGILLAFNLVGRRKKKEKKKGNRGITLDSLNKKSIGDTVDYYNGKDSFFLKRELEDTRSLLKEIGKENEYAKTITSCIVCSMIGAGIGFFILNNLGAGLILTAGMFFVPIWRIKSYSNKHRKYIAAQLETATTLITTSYIRNNNLSEAVAENLEQLSPIIKPVFQDFVNECKINTSTKNCIRNMRDKINDSIFKEWCETLIRTVDNSEMREALVPIYKKFSTVRKVQDDVDSEIMSTIWEYLILMAAVIGVYFLVYIMNKQWFSYYDTFSGKIIISLSLLVDLFSLIKLIGLMKPVKFDR